MMSCPSNAWSNPIKFNAIEIRFAEFWDNVAFPTAVPSGVHIDATELISCPTMDS